MGVVFKEDDVSLGVGVSGASSAALASDFFAGLGAGDSSDALAPARDVRPMLFASNRIQLKLTRESNDVSTVGNSAKTVKDSELRRYDSHHSGKAMHQLRACHRTHLRDSVDYSWK